MRSNRGSERNNDELPLGGATAVLAAMLLLMPSTAFAYIDPGTGSILWQMLLGLLVGAGFYFRQIAGWFTRKQR